MSVPSVTIVLVATDSPPWLANALEALKTHGHEFLLMGQGEKWGGWRHRMKLYRDAATKLEKRDPEGLIVCMDAYDALSMRPLASLVDAFESFHKPLVLGMEKFCGGNCVPLDAWWKAKLGPGERPPRDKYVNGGLLMGKASKIRTLYEWMLDYGETDDQRGLAQFALAHPDDWAPDIYGRLFKNKILGEHLPEADMQARGAYFAHFPGMLTGDPKPYEAAVFAVTKHPSGVLQRANCNTNNSTDPAFIACMLVIFILGLVWLILISFLAAFLLAHHTQQAQVVASDRAT